MPSRRSEVIRHRYRRATSLLRVLPSFFIIGSPRCGTTSVFKMLTRHSSVVPPVTKEIAYFNVFHERRLGWYRSAFPTRGRELWTRLRTGAFMTGEATPSYLFHPHAAKRLRHVAPDAKFIVLLRNPIDRAYSHYHWARRKGFELLSFEEAIDREESRNQGELERMIEDERYLSFPRSYLSYLSMGLYADQLRSWLEVFERRQFLVLSAEQLQERPEQTMAEILEFLGLRDEPVASSKTSNVGHYTSIDPATRRRLREWFRPGNERLTDLLRIDFGWNREVDVGR